jgi:hypothetical protein
MDKQPAEEDAVKQATLEAAVGPDAPAWEVVKHDNGSKSAMVRT